MNIFPNILFTPLKKKKMKRTYLKTVNSKEDSISFRIYNHRDKHNAAFEQLQFGKEGDFYVLKFHRPGLSSVHLYTFYVLRNERECIYSTSLDYPTNQCVTLMDRCYKVYDTYTLGQDTEDANVTYSMYFQFKEGSICVDMSRFWLPKHIPHFDRHIEFFPYDVDPTMYGLKLDTTKVPQRTPLWLKVRGEVTGTKAYQLIGFWVPTVEDDPNWTLDGDHVFDAQSKANMKFGSDSEDKALIAYAFHFNHPISLTGWCNAPAPFPKGWGSSPDGLITDATHTWDDVPDAIKKYLDTTLFDPRQGVLEIKSSKFKLSMEAYFFPQVYMEMISTNRMWCDLVRYKPNKVRVYRIYRHKPTEETLVSLWKYARKNVHSLRKIIQEESFVKIREYFEKLANTLPFLEVTMTETIQKQIKSYEEYLVQKQTGIKVEDTGFLTKKAKTMWFEEVDTNHKAFYGVINDPKKLKDLVLKQMSLYNEALKDLE